MFTTLLDWLYSMPSPQRTRSTSDKSMEVLCLGLSRSDTDSLRSALDILGYTKIYHRSTLTSSQRSDCKFWVPLMERKYKKAKAFVPGIQFDTVLGDCQVAMDVPAYVFSEELIVYYPEAKVILNRRREINAWYATMQIANADMFGWYMWTLSWFSVGLYWLWRMFYLAVPGYFDYYFDENGKSYGKAHYINLKDVLDDNKREFLEWSEEDGWEPLCTFLNKPIPKEPFPAQNRPLGQHEVKAMDGIGDLSFTALRNLSILLVPISGLLVFYRTLVLRLIIQAYFLAQKSREREDVIPDFDP